MARPERIVSAMAVNGEEHVVARPDELQDAIQGIEKDHAFRDWDKDVWKVVAKEYANLKDKKPLTQEEGAVGQTLPCAATFKEVLRTKGELRNVCMNICSIDPTVAIFTDDTIVMETVEKSGRHFFWDGATDRPSAPSVWPRSQTIPIACCQTHAIPTPCQPYGSIEVVRGFWWAFARLLQLEYKEEELDRFRKLAKSCVVDFTHFVDDVTRAQAAFQLLLTVEHRRESGGFTGHRRIKLVAWAVDVLRKRSSNSNKAPDGSNSNKAPDLGRRRRGLSTRRLYFSKSCGGYAVRLKKWQHCGGNKRPDFLSKYMTSLKCLKWLRNTKEA